MSTHASLAMVNLDCADPKALAAFYGEALGWEIAHSEDEYAMISGDGVSIGFGRVEDYRAPEWPGSDAAPKRYHLDLYVDDLVKVETRFLELGAVKPEFQPGGGRWHVLLDPGGHPFCLCPRR